MHYRLLLCIYAYIVYEVFKKYSADMKKRSWGLCSVSHFTPINEVVNEHILNVFIISYSAYRFIFKVFINFKLL